MLAAARPATQGDADDRAVQADLLIHEIVGAPIG
jgi:hypothetical protein